MESIFYKNSARVKKRRIDENTLGQLRAEREAIRAEYMPLLEKLRKTDDYEQSEFDHHRLLYKRLDWVEGAIWCLERDNK
jgi:hypothetical protein